MERNSIEYVLLNEVDNPNSVYLYLEGDAWCAYERSAYYLAAIKQVCLEKEIVDGYEVILLKARFKIDDMCLPLSPGVYLKSVADDKLQFNMNRRVDGFSEWKREQLAHLSA